MEALQEAEEALTTSKQANNNTNGTYLDKCHGLEEGAVSVGQSCCQCCSTNSPVTATSQGQCHGRIPHSTANMKERPEIIWGPGDQVPE